MNLYQKTVNSFVSESGTQLDEEVELLEDVTQENKVVLYNDDVNTFDWVIECLIEICEHDEIQAEQCALLVHFKGKAVVKTGSLENMQAICQALCDRDLSATIE
ncbi:MAG: ATP-dependent Clp protease adaptor ClpS [Bacteroidetes bacterium]|nr:ATP-dependent Clp protease adaptor ClpS [Bacteroidota bacterium]MCK6609408.1 ATP-dependent Clp protease adaptor ClpS [Bacteroidia bacterium]